MMLSWLDNSGWDLLIRAGSSGGGGRVVCSNGDQEVYGRIEKGSVQRSRHCTGIGVH